MFDFIKFLSTPIRWMIALVLLVLASALLAMISGWFRANVPLQPGPSSPPFNDLTDLPTPSPTTGAYPQPTMIELPTPTPGAYPLPQTKVESPTPFPTAIPTPTLWPVSALPLLKVSLPQKVFRGIRLLYTHDKAPGYYTNTIDGTDEVPWKPDWAIREAGGVNSGVFRAAPDGSRILYFIWTTMEMELTSIDHSCNEDIDFASVAKTASPAPAHTLDIRPGIGEYFR